MAEVEHDIRVFPIDAQLQDRLQVLVREGWDLVPGVTPVAVYHLVRVKKEAVTPDLPVPDQNFGGPSGFGKLLIDDSKVFIFGPDGKPRVN